MENIMANKPLELVEVVWHDACIRAEQVLGSDLEEYDAGVTNSEIGHFVGFKKTDGRDFIVLSTEKSEEGKEPFRGVTDIPLSIVKEIWRLERKEEVWAKLGRSKLVRRGTRMKENTTTKGSSRRS